MLRFAHELGWPVSVALPVGRSGGEPVALERRLAREIERACWLDRELAAVAAADVDHFVVDELPEGRRAERAGTHRKIKLRGPGPGTPAPPRYRLTGAPEDAEGLRERVRVAEARADWSAARVAVLERQANGPPAHARATRNGSGAERPEHKVMHGRDGWLFVAHDGADVADQLTGRRVLTGGQVKAWLKTLRKREAAVRKRGTAYVFAVAPLIHHLFPEHLPPGLEPASPRPVERIAAAMAADRDDLPPLVYPLEALRGARAHGRATASRVDSHWNGWGAFLAYREIMAALPPGVRARASGGHRPGPARGGRCRRPRGQGRAAHERGDGDRRAARCLDRRRRGQLRPQLGPDRPLP
jgi:hypothetical protein